jgi:hypothetical protein
VNHEIDDISGGENMKRSESCEEERSRKKQEAQEQVDFYEEMIRRLYIGSDSGG